MLVNRRTVRIEWGDCDAAGIVFYPRYFAFFDASTQALFEAAGWLKRDLIREFAFIGFPMVDTRARFLVPSTFGDDVVIETTITDIRRSSFDVHHKLLKPDGAAEVLAVEGFETRVWTGSHPTEPGRLKAQPIPDVVVRRLRGE